MTILQNLFEEGRLQSFTNNSIVQKLVAIDTKLDEMGPVDVGKRTTAAAAGIFLLAYAGREVIDAYEVLSSNGLQFANNLDAIATDALNYMDNKVAANQAGEFRLIEMLGDLQGYVEHAHNSLVHQFIDADSNTVKEILYNARTHASEAIVNYADAIHRMTRDCTNMPEGNTCHPYASGEHIYHMENMAAGIRHNADMIRDAANPMEALPKVIGGILGLRYAVNRE